MDIKRVILIEIDEFEWIKNIPEGIPLPDEFNYLINLCDTNYTTEDLKDKIIELFGNEIIGDDNGTRSSHLHINWFDNDGIEEENYEIVLYLQSTPSGVYEVRGGWDVCYEYEADSRKELITPETFLRFVK